MNTPIDFSVNEALLNSLLNARNVIPYVLSSLSGIHRHCPAASDPNIPGIYMVWHGHIGGLYVTGGPPVLNPLPAD